MALFQLVSQIKITSGVLFHTGKESRLCFRNGFDLRRHHIAEVIQPHITLALHAEGRDTVAGDLGKQSAADPLDAKGEAGVLNGAGMAQIAEHRQEFCSFFFVQPVQQIGDVGIGIAQLCRCGHYLFGFRGMGNQTNSHHKFVIPPQ